MVDIPVDRKVSVDFVSSKKALESEKEKANEPNNKEENNKEEQSEDEEMEEGEKEESEVESTATDEDSQSVMGEEDCAESATRVNPNDVKEGKTLFVRYGGL